MGSPFQAQRITRLAQMVYAVLIHRIDGQIVFIHYDSYNQALDMKEATKHSEYRRRLEEAQGMVEIEIVAGFSDLQMARRVWRDLCHAHQPLIGTSNFKSQPRIQCVETGAIYANASQAAAAHDISRSAMSNHLNSRKGYAHVKHLHFRRIVNVPTEGI